MQQHIDGGNDSHLYKIAHIELYLAHYCPSNLQRQMENHNNDSKCVRDRYKAHKLKYLWYGRFRGSRRKTINNSVAVENGIQIQD